MNRPKGKRINSHKRVPENKLFLFFFFHGRVSENIGSVFDYLVFTEIKTF